MQIDTLKTTHGQTEFMHDSQAHTRFNVFGLMAILACLSSADVSAAADSIPQVTMRNAILGSYRGTFTDCTSQAFELVLSEGHSDSDDFLVEGRMKASNSAGTSTTTLQLDMPVSGVQLADSGYVSLASKPPKAPQSAKERTDPIALLSEKFGRKQQAQTPAVSQDFRMGFIRDYEGHGYVGVFLIPTSDCHSFLLTRVDGTASGMLPMPDVQFIYAQAGLVTKFILEEPPFNGKMGYSPSHNQSMPGLPPVFYGQPWLLYADKLGHPMALSSLGRIYEFGLGVPLNYDEALRYYTQAAAHNNASAQAGLARLYGSGLGVERDISRSKQFSAQYNTTRVAALKLCTAPSMLDVTTKLILDEMHSPPPMTPGNILAGAMNSSLDIDAGSSFVYQTVSVVNLASVDKPFLCKYSVKAVNAKVTDMTPYRQWRVTTADGVTYYYDNKDEIKEGQATADLLTVLSNIVPALEVFEVRAQGGSKYGLSRMEDGMAGLAPAVNVEVDIPSIH